MKHKIILISILTGYIEQFNIRAYSDNEIRPTLCIFESYKPNRQIAMKIICFSIVFLLPVWCAAQNVSVPEGYEAKENLRELGSMDGTGNVRTFDNRYEGVKGTPYVFEEFHPGEVYLKTKNKVSVQDLNYNCVENEIIYLDPATQVNRVMNRFQVDLFTIQEGGQTHTFVPVKLEGDQETIFAEVLYNKASDVYKVYYKDWLQANYEGGYSADRRYDQFVDKYDLYFIKAGENMLYKARKSNKLIKEAFPEHEKEISSFLKSNKLDLKEGEALVQLMEYYDTL